MGIYNRYKNLKIARPNDDSYPRWIDINNIPVLVHSSEEENNLLNPLPVAEPNPEGFGESLGTKEEYKKSLLSEAVELGIPARKTWGVEKLRKAIHDSKRSADISS